MSPQPRPSDAAGDDPLAEVARRATYDHAAAAELVRAMQAEVWRLCRALVDDASAEDLTQETFLRVFAALPGFRGESTVRVWVLAIARRTAMDHLRKVVRQRALDAALRRQRPPGPPTLASRLEVDQALARLPVDLRTAFVLTQVLGLEYAEAAGVVGCPIGTIRSRVARARQRLVADLSDPER